MWTCEFCHVQTDENPLPPTWDFVWQSAVCPACQERVKADGGYSVVPAGAYAGDRPDPRDRDLSAAVDEADRILRSEGRYA